MYIRKNIRNIEFQIAFFIVFLIFKSCHLTKDTWRHKQLCTFRRKSFFISNFELDMKLY